MTYSPMQIAVILSLSMPRVGSPTFPQWRATVGAFADSFSAALEGFDRAHFYRVAKGWTPTCEHTRFRVPLHPTAPAECIDCGTNICDF